MRNMKLRKIVIVLIVLISLSICTTEIVIRTHERDESTELIVDAMVNILATCYGNEKFAIGVTKTFPQAFLKTLWSRKRIPIVLINNTVHVTNPREVDYLSLHRLNVFVIVANDMRQHKRELYNILLSRWFNREASFLIVDWSPIEKYGCRNTTLTKLLERAVYLRIFNLNILCLHRTKGRMLFTYNPHTDKAPGPWQLAVTFNKLPQLDGASVFEREYRQEGVCKNLNFDKIMDLGGRSIELLRYRRNIGSQSAAFQRLYPRTYAHEQKLRNIVLTFTRHLNGTMKTIIIDADYVMPKDVMDSLLSMSAFQYTFIRTHPFMQTSVSTATNFVGYKSQLTKIINLIDVYSRVGTCVTILITLVFFKVINRQRFIPALLNVFRMTVNTGFTKLHETEPSRIYRTGLYFFVVTIHGIFAGALAALLTRDVPVEYPQTIRQLADANYTIYIPFFNVKEVQLLEYEARYIIVTPLDNRHCLDYVTDAGSSAACVAPTHEFSDRADKYKISVSRAPIDNEYMVAMTDEQWPYATKFNEMVLAMAAGDIVDTLDMRIAGNQLSLLESDNEGPKVMTLKILLFAFEMLGIGLACSTLCFIIEVTNKPLRLAITKVRRRLSNCFRRIKSTKLKRQKLKVQKLQVTRV